MGWEATRYGNGHTRTVGGWLRLEVAWSTNREEPGYYARIDGYDLRVNDKVRMFDKAVDAMKWADACARKRLQKALDELETPVTDPEVKALPFTVRQQRAALRVAVLALRTLADMTGKVDDRREFVRKAACAMVSALEMGDMGWYPMAALLTRFVDGDGT